MNLSAKEVASYIEGYELKRSTFAGVDRDDVSVFVEHICGLYEAQLAKYQSENKSISDELDSLKKDNVALEFNALQGQHDNLILELKTAKEENEKLEERNRKLNEKLNVLEVQIQDRKTDSDMVMEILMDAKKKSETEAIEMAARRDSILEEAKAESRRILENAENSKYDIIRNATKDKENILLAANEKAQELMDKQNQLLSDARKEAYVIVQQAQVKAETLNKEAQDNLLDADRERIAIIEKANQKAEEIILDSREKNEAFIRQNDEMAARISEKQGEYAKYISDVENKLIDMRQNLVDFKRVMNLPMSIEVEDK